MTRAGNPSTPSPNEIRLVNPLGVTNWNENLAEISDAGFFHTSCWAQVLHETYGYQPFYHAIYESGRLRSLLPIMEVDSWLTGRRGVGLPFTDLVPPLCRDRDSFQLLFGAASKFAKTRQWKYLECRGGKQWLPEAPAATSFLRHTLDLTVGESQLFTGFDDSVRRAVRKAERNNLKLEFSQSSESMQVFYQLLCRTRRRHGVPPQPFPFFANIHRHVLANGHGWVVLVRHGSLPVAGAVFFHFGRHVIYKFGASDETQQQLRANNLVMWRAIQHYARQGFAHLDFGRTSLGNVGLRKFKLGWGAQEEQIDYIRYRPISDTYLMAKDDAQGWHNQIFRSLPLALSRLAGTVLYRHMG